VSIDVQLGLVLENHELAEDHVYEIVFHDIFADFQAECKSDQACQDMQHNIEQRFTPSDFRGHHDPERR
jgi:hypothetical protein